MAKFVLYSAHIESVPEMFRMKHKAVLSSFHISLRHGHFLYLIRCYEASQQGGVLKRFTNSGIVNFVLNKTL